MPTPQLRWTDEEVARLRAAGRSWREISERTGLSVPEAKAAVMFVRAGIRQRLRERRAAAVLAATVCTTCGTPHGEHRPGDEGRLACPFRAPGSSFFTAQQVEPCYPQLYGRYRTDARAHARIEERLAGVPVDRSVLVDPDGYGRGAVLGTPTAVRRRRARLKRRRLARGVKGSVTS